ncbi:hypothetical protein CRUP_025658 [Coryphaenoides rupestris]|nr:hypothetical protein CRUP_025658 [Coryphaenoides rupestris]
MRHLLVFQMWMVSSSTFSCFSACSSRKSKKYLMAGGTTAPEHRTLRKKSSTNCWRVPWKRFNARAKVYFASLLTVALHGKLEYYTDKKREDTTHSTT